MQCRSGRSGSELLGMQPYPARHWSLCSSWQYTVNQLKEPHFQVEEQLEPQSSSGQRNGFRYTRLQPEAPPRLWRHAAAVPAKEPALNAEGLEPVPVSPQDHCQTPPTGSLPAPHVCSLDLHTWS